MKSYIGQLQATGSALPRGNNVVLLYGDFGQSIVLFRDSASAEHDIWLCHNRSICSPFASSSRQPPCNIPFNFLHPLGLSYISIYILWEICHPLILSLRHIRPCCLPTVLGAARLWHMEIFSLKIQINKILTLGRSILLKFGILSMCENT